MAPAPDKNYFDLFGLPAGFDIDAADLSARYRTLARESHPDRFAGGSDAERRLAMQMTTMLNEAFRVLKEPISRARYLLEVKGVTLPQGTVAAVAPAFLVQQMELRERLEEIGADRAALDRLGADVGELLREKERVLGAQLSPSTWHPQEAMLTVQEMQFLDKLRHQIHDLQESN
jgi:molecular chaperone HscB